MGDTFIQTTTIMFSTMYFNIVRVCVDDNLNGVVYINSYPGSSGWVTSRAPGFSVRICIALGPHKHLLIYYLDGMTTLLQVCMYQGKPLFHDALPRDSDRVWDRTQEWESVPALQLILRGLFWRNTRLADSSGHFQMVTRCQEESRASSVSILPDSEPAWSSNT